MAPQSNEDSVSFKSHVWLLFTRARGGHRGTVVLQLFGKQREDGLLRACCQLSWVQTSTLPPGQKLIKSSCDISRDLAACFHSFLCFPSLRSATFFFSPESLVFWVMCGSEAAGGSQSDHRTGTESPHSLPAHAVLEPLRGPPPLSPLLGSNR